MTIPLTPQISLSPSSFSASGQTITASVTLPNRPEYAGKPAITGLTTITPKIVCSRTPSGVFPFFIQVSACETTSNAGSAYNDLHYEWNFGDATGEETMIDRWNGKTVNPNDSQVGPEAGYLYRNIGTYTVTLTVSGKDENGDTVTASTTSILTLGQFYIFLGNATGGTYTLTVNGETTASIAYNASSATILTALRNLASLDTTNVRMTYNGCVEFFGNLAGSTITFTGNFAGLTGATGTPQLRTEQLSGTSSVVSANAATGWTIQYYDSQYDGSNGASNGTITRPHTSGLSTFINSGNNKFAYLKRGSSMSVSYSNDRGYRGIRVVPYGSGANPIVSGGVSLELNWGSASTPTRTGGDFVFSGFTITTGGASAWFTSYSSNNDDPNYPYARFRDIVFDDIAYTNTAASGNAYFMTAQGISGRGMALSNIHFWDCSLAMGNTAKHGLFTTADQWFGVFGGSISGGNGSTVLDHHIYSNILLHQCFRYINFGNGNKGFCINGNAHNDASLTQYYLCDGCNITGTQNGLDFSNSNNDSGVPGRFEDCIVQFNTIHIGQAGSQKYGVFGYNVKNLTIRHNNMYENTSGGIHIFDATCAFSIYANRCYNSPWNFYGTQTAYMYDNANYSNSASFGCMQLYGSTPTTAQSWTVDRNTWYAPSRTAPFYRPDTSAYLTFVTWQTYDNDPNGVQQNPSWHAPTSGQFIKDPTVKINWPDGFTSLESSIDDGASWQSYTDDTTLSIGTNLTNHDTVMFRAITDGTVVDVTIGIESDSASLDTELEAQSAILSFYVEKTTYLISTASLVYVVQT